MRVHFVSLPNLHSFPIYICVWFKSISTKSFAMKLYRCDTLFLLRVSYHRIPGVTLPSVTGVSLKYVIPVSGCLLITFTSYLDPTLAFMSFNTRLVKLQTLYLSASNYASVVPITKLSFVGPTWNLSILVIGKILCKELSWPAWLYGRNVSSSFMVVRWRLKWMQYSIWWQATD
jgi:hypothetical protein